MAFNLYKFSFPWRSALHQIKYYGIALLIFIAGVLISWGLFHLYRINNHKRLQAEFNRQADIHILSIKQRIETTIIQLEYIKRFYYASNEVIAKEFYTFVQFILKEYPGFLGIGWVQNDPILPYQGPFFFRFSSPQASLIHLSEKKFGLKFLELNDPMPFYIDLKGWPNFIEALQASQNSLTLQLSSPVPVYQSKKRECFFAFNPLFRSSSENIEAQPLSGTIMGLIELERILSPHEKQTIPSGISITIYDVTDAPPKQIYSNQASDQKGQNSWSREYPFHLANRIWKIEATPLSPLFQQTDYAWMILLGGLSLSGLTAAYFLMLVNRRLIVEQEVLERTKELAFTNQILQTANQAKSEFLTTISHELRTPLNAIIGFDQCLLMGMDGPINENQRVSLEKIEKSSFHLLNLINDLLDLTKIEANKMELEIAPHNIIDLVDSCIDEVQPLATQKKLAMQRLIPSSPLLIEMDSRRIRQVLLNLLGNAIKFTEQGGITVTLLNQEKNVEIQIQDTGIGMNSLGIQKIFKPFSQVDNSITRKYGGTGLGLAISKKIVDLHNGTIKVQSEKGVGSTFTVSLPKAQ